MSAEGNFARLNLELPPPPDAVGVYKPVLLVGGVCYTSGHLPILPNGSIITGCVGRDADQERGFEAAQQAGLTLLASLKKHLGSLDRVSRVIKVFGLVQCTDEFFGQPAVINGCSELFRNVFGEDAGVGARSAVGANALPLGAMVEIEAIFEIHKD